MKVGIISQNKEVNMIGINRVTIGTLSELIEIDKENAYYFIGNPYWLGMDIPYVPVIPTTSQPILLNYLLAEHPFDVIHSHYRAFHFSDRLHCGKVLTIHDLIPLKFPDFAPPDSYAYFDECIRRSAEEADTVIAVSRCTKNDIVQYYGISEDKVRVVYNGLYPKDFIVGDKMETVEQLEGQDFLLSVSGIGKNKNQKGIVESFLIYKQRYPESRMKLALTGAVRQYETVRDILDKYGGTAKDVIFTGYVSEAQLAWLYRQAVAFIYASFYEGFGLPILEAMSVGKAVISSNTSSMPEVGGDAVEYCDPGDIDSIAVSMERVLEDMGYREQLEKRALVQAKKFTYGNAARQTLEIYRQFE